MIYTRFQPTKTWLCRNLGVYKLGMSQVRFVCGTCQVVFGSEREGIQHIYKSGHTELRGQYLFNDRPHLQVLELSNVLTWLLGSLFTYMILGMLVPADYWFKNGQDGSAYLLWLVASLFGGLTNVLLVSRHRRSRFRKNRTASKVYVQRVTSGEVYLSLLVGLKLGLIAVVDFLQVVWTQFELWWAVVALFILFSALIGVWFVDREGTETTEVTLK